MKKIQSMVVMHVLVILFCGCESVRIKTKKEDVRSGLFSNNKEQLLIAFDQIERGKTCRDDLEKAGFDLKSHNIHIYDGVPAFKALFGQEAFRNLDPEKFEQYLPEYNRYQLIEIPYKFVETRSDRIYLSKKHKHMQGWDITLSIVLRDGVIIYNAPRQIYHDTHEVDRAFLQGVFDIFQGVNGAAGKVIK